MKIPNKFGYKIANASASDAVVALLTGNLDTIGFNVTQSGTTPFAVSAVAAHYHDTTALVAYGVPVDAVADDGTIATDITCTSTNTQAKVRHMREYVKFNPQLLQKLVIEASNKDVFEQSLFVRQDNPLRGTAPQEIPLSTYLNTMQVQENKIEIPLGNIPIGDETILYMNIPAGRTVTFRYELADFNPWTNQVV